MTDGDHYVEVYTSVDGTHANPGSRMWYTVSNGAVSITDIGNAQSEKARIDALDAQLIPQTADVLPEYYYITDENSTYYVGDKLDQIYELTDAITNGMTDDEDKLKAIHDWVCENFYYDYDSLNSDSTAPDYMYDTSRPSTVWESAALNGGKYRATCSGFSRIMQIMLTHVGVPCINQMGKISDGVNILKDAGSDHEWNLVYINGSWHEVDATWDCFNSITGGVATTKEKIYDYYGCAPEFLGQTHRGESFQNAWEDYTQTGFQSVGANDWRFVMFATMGANAATYRTGWLDIDGALYHFEDHNDFAQAGKMSLGWTTINDNLYYFREYTGVKGSGGAYRNTTVEIGGQNYTFDANGVCQTGNKLVETITLNQTSKSLYCNENFTLTAVVTPSDATNSSLLWTSDNEAVASVDAAGKVTAHGVEGSAKITCAAQDGSGKVAECSVTVSKKKVTNITLSKTQTTLFVGGTETLTKTLTPADPTDASVSWSSSNPTVATVDTNGKITAKAAGTATITCTAKGGDNKSAACTVTVRTAVSDVSLTYIDNGQIKNIKNSNLTIAKPTSGTFALIGSVLPNNAFNTGLTWSSSNTSVATVNAQGLVTVKAAGKTVITATAKGDASKKASCTVNIRLQASSIAIDKKTANVQVGKTVKLNATVSPTGATDKSVTWVSSGLQVATVDSKGNVKGVHPGTTTIYAVTNDGSNKKVACTVTVPSPTVKISAAVDYVEVGKTIKLSATSTSEETMTWSSQTTSVATIDAQGNVKGVKAGYVNILVRTACGAGTYKQIRVLSPVEAFVARLYTNVLGRNFEAEGLASWTQQLLNKTKTGATVADGFISSSELTARNLSDEAYVEMLYQTFLGRGADTDGKTGWLDKLNKGMSRRFLFAGFVGSQEFAGICKSYGIEVGSVTMTEARDKNDGVTMFVYRCYQQALGRTADVGGLNTWCEQLLNKTKTPKEVAAGFVFSPELTNRKLSNADYVKVMYRLFMGREYDQGGLDNWVKALNEGKTREEVFNGFADSNEFAEIVASYHLN